MLGLTLNSKYNKVVNELNVIKSMPTYPASYSNEEVNAIITNAINNSCKQIKESRKITPEYGYSECSVIFMVIDKICTTVQNGKWTISNKEVEDTFLPNPLQNWQQFISDIVLYYHVYGGCYLYKYKIVGVKMPYFYVLPPTQCKPIVNSDANAFGSTFKDLITEYKITYGNKVCSITDTDSILCLLAEYKSLSKQIVRVPKSKIPALSYEIRNVIQAQETIFALNNDRGAQGMLSSDKKDANGTFPLLPNEKAEVEKRLQTTYGLGVGQYKVILTDVPLKWQQMSYSVKDLMLFDGIKENIESIANAFNYPFELLSNGKGTTFSNKREAKAFLYQDNIIPLCNMIASTLSNLLGETVSCDFSHVEALRAAEKDLNDSKRSLAQSYHILYNNGVITREEFRIAMGYAPEVSGTLIDPLLVTNIRTTNS